MNKQERRTELAARSFFGKDQDIRKATGSQSGIGGVRFKKAAGSRQ
jgi:hypothetical protein